MYIQKDMLFHKLLFLQIPTILSIYNFRPKMQSKQWFPDHVRPSNTESPQRTILDYPEP